MGTFTGYLFGIILALLASVGIAWGVREVLAYFGIFLQLWFVTTVIVVLGFIQMVIAVRKSRR